MSSRGEKECIGNEWVNEIAVLWFSCFPVNFTKIFRRVLGVDKIGNKTHFFDAIFEDKLSLEIWGWS